MRTAIVAAMVLAALFLGVPALNAADMLSDEGVKCVFTHHDMWKGKMSGEGMLFLEVKGSGERLCLRWGKSRDALVQKEEFSLKRIVKEDGKEIIPAPPPWYQEFSDMLKKALEWDAAATANGLEDVHKPIALDWAYHKLKKGTPAWISKTWGDDAKYELIEIRIDEVPKLLKLLETVPDMEKEMQDVNKKLKDEADSKKADEKSRKEKVDSLLK
jgi:hypothetical protein